MSGRQYCEVCKKQFKFSKRQYSDSEVFQAGLLAGGAIEVARVIVTHPLDTIKTHVQLATSNSESSWRLATRLIRRDGLASLYSGFAPRFVHLSLWGTALITIYEELKRVCRKPPPPGSEAAAVQGPSIGVLLWAGPPAELGALAAPLQEALGAFELAPLSVRVPRHSRALLQTRWVVAVSAGLR